MEKENGKANEGSSGPSKVSNVQDPAALLDAASLFGAYWPRGDASAANLFAAAGSFGLPPHAAAALPFGMLPPATAAQGGRGGGSGSGGSGGLQHSYPAASTASSTSAAAAAAAAYSNAAYSNTLSVAASQAASLGMPAASAAWWSMASHLAAQDYLARLQASGLNFPLGGHADLQYSALGMPSLAGHHKPKGASKSTSRSASGSASKDKMAAALGSSSGGMKMDHHNTKINSSLSTGKTSSNNSLKYSSPSGLTIQPSIKLSSSNSSSGGDKVRKTGSELSYLSKLDNKQKISASASVKPSSPSPSIFSNPLSLASNQDKGGVSILNSGSQNSVNSGNVASLPSSILSILLIFNKVQIDHWQKFYSI